MAKAVEQSTIDEEWERLSLESQTHIMKAALAARQLARNLTREHWLTIGQGVIDVQDGAMRRSGANHNQHPIYRRFHRIYMERVPDLAALAEADHAGCHHATWLFRNWDTYVDEMPKGGTPVSSWLDGTETTEHLRRRLQHPSTIYKTYMASFRTRPQGAEKAPTPLARKEARIEQLSAEVNELQMENRRLKRGADDLTEGRDWTWQDTADQIAATWLRLYPSKALQAASKVMELSKSTRPRKVGAPVRSSSR
jgi:hypothetical protein